MGVRHYRDLIAWQKAMDLVVEIYRATESFPQREIYGLTNQMRRAAVSIPSNLAEGQGRSSTKDFCNFLSIAIGSVQELETQVLIAERLGFLKEEYRQPLLERISEVSRIVHGLRSSLAD